MRDKSWKTGGRAGGVRGVGVRVKVGVGVRVEVGLAVEVRVGVDVGVANNEEIAGREVQPERIRARRQRKK